MFIINSQYIRRINDKIVGVDFVGLRYKRFQEHLNNLSDTCATHAKHLGAKYGLTHGGFLALFCKDYTTDEILQIGVIKVNSIKPKNGNATPDPPEKAMDATYTDGLYLDPLGSTVKKGVRIGDKVIFAIYENAGDPSHLVDIFLAKMNSYAHQLFTSTVAA